MMTVIIREIYQDPGQVGKLSFPPKGMEEFRQYGSDKLLKVDSDYEDTEEESGYTIVGGEEVEVLPEEPDNGDEETDNEEV